MSDEFLELRLRKSEVLKGAPERRTFQVPQLEIREARDGQTASVSGYAAVTGVEYEVGNASTTGWVEVIQPGAFRRTLAGSPDVVLNAMHGRGLSGLPLARTRSGTLALREDATGLHFAAELDIIDPDVRTLIPKMLRGDLDGASLPSRSRATRSRRTGAIGRSRAST